MKNDQPQFLPSCFYHVYNRGNNKENLFYHPDNYAYFLKKYAFYLSDWVDTYAYCLLPNHFHLLIKVKEEELLPMPALNLPGLRDLEGFASHQTANSPKHSEPLTSAQTVSSQFRHFFTSYSKAINKREQRNGSLFQKNFKRLLLDDFGHLTNLIVYIHTNPQVHGLISDFRDYPFSSYRTLCSTKPTRLCRSEVLDWSGGYSGFEIFHTQYLEHKGLELEEIER